MGPRVAGHGSMRATAAIPPPILTHASMLRLSVLLFVILFAAVAAAGGDDERDESMDLTPIWKPHAGAMLNLDFQDGRTWGESFSAACIATSRIR